MLLKEEFEAGLIPVLERIPVDPLSSHPSYRKARGLVDLQSRSPTRLANRRRGSSRYNTYVVPQVVRGKHLRVVLAIDHRPMRRVRR